MTPGALLETQSGNSTAHVLNLTRVMYSLFSSVKCMNLIYTNLCLVGFDCPPFNISGEKDYVSDDCGSLSTEI
jgi:hypothetical protein